MHLSLASWFAVCNKIFWATIQHQRREKIVKMEMMPSTAIVPHRVTPYNSLTLFLINNISIIITNITRLYALIRASFVVIIFSSQNFLKEIWKLSQKYISKYKSMRILDVSVTYYTRIYIFYFNIRCSPICI